VILFDFLCPKCHAEFEDLVPQAAMYTTCACGAEAARCMPAPKTFTAIVPTTKTSKRLKAGYVHQFRKKKPDAPVMVQVPRNGA
jgi:hypothetical protein